MNLFDVLIVQPVFNVLVLIYGLLPGNDFGIALILFTILVRLAMWPLIKKQLHQTKVMRQMQPQLKRIKKQAKGNKQLEAQLMMELYRERGVNPLAPFGLLLAQLPIFFALYQVVNIITTQRDRIGAFTYDTLQQIPFVGSLVANPDRFNESLLGVVDLARNAFSGGIYLPAVALAVIAAVFQYIQSKQITPQPSEKKRLRDMLKEQAAGKDVDQADISAAMSNKIMVVLPLVTLAISLYLPGALVLYFAVSSIVAVIQQYFVLRQDVDEMEDLADKPSTKVKTSVKTKTVADRAEAAVEAEIVTSPNPKPQKKRKGKKRR